MGQKYVSYCANKCPASLKANHGNWSYAHLKISKLLRLFGVINLISCATNIPMVFYKHMADLVQNLKSSNTFLTVQHRELKYTSRSTDDLKDSWYLDESKRRAQLTNKDAVVGEYYRMFKVLPIIEDTLHTHYRGQYSVFARKLHTIMSLVCIQGICMDCSGESLKIKKNR